MSDRAGAAEADRMADGKKKRWGMGNGKMPIFAQEGQGKPDRILPELRTAAKCHAFSLDVSA